MLLSAVFLTLSASLALASPLSPRAAADNTVRIDSASKYCMIMPRKAHTDIGTSESEGQMQSYCTASARTDNSQGLLPDNFWTKVTYKKGRGKGDWVQLTGRIKKGFSQLNDNDGGGQYDSTGGAGAAGNPRGSTTTMLKLSSLMLAVLVSAAAKSTVTALLTRIPQAAQLSFLARTENQKWIHWGGGSSA